MVGDFSHISSLDEYRSQCLPRTLAHTGGKRPAHVGSHMGGPAAYEPVSEIRSVNSDRVEEPDEGEQVAAGANRADPDVHGLGL